MVLPFVSGAWRFQKKLPKPCADKVPIVDCLISLFRLRAEQSWWLQNAALQRFTRKLAQVWGQHVEVAIEGAMKKECPDPTLESKNHPFAVASRRKGSKALAMSLVHRFTCKGGGFVTCKNELNLKELGVVKGDSNLGSRTSSEYVLRALMVNADFCSMYLRQARLKVINFAMDAASIGGEHVLW